MIDVGEVVDSRYRVLRHVATGGMGSVYVVSGGEPGEALAMKLMADDDPSLRERFLREIRTIAGLDHPNIVRVRDFGVDLRVGPYFVMDLLEGESLDVAVEKAPPRKRPFDPERTLSILTELYAGAQHAHKAGVVHCDLKPTNVFLAAPDSTVKIVDFGIAERTITHPHLIPNNGGTPFWMAPEQFQPGARSPASDVWALALVTFYILTAKPFWLADPGQFGALYAEICLHALPLASERAAGLSVGHLLPAELDRWFSRCLQRHASARFPDAGAAFEALFGVLSGRPADSKGRVRLINPYTPAPSAVEPAPPSSDAEERHIAVAAAVLSQRIAESVRQIQAAAALAPAAPRVSQPDLGVLAPQGGYPQAAFQNAWTPPPGAYGMAIQPYPVAVRGPSANLAQQGTPLPAWATPTPGMVSPQALMPPPPSSIDPGAASRGLSAQTIVLSIIIGLTIGGCLLFIVVIILFRGLP